MCRGIVFLLASLFFSPVHAWFDSGHMISSWIAWQNMTPIARQRSQELLDVLKEAEPQTHSFIIASTWMDAIKKEGLAVTGYWHTVSDDQVVNGLANGPQQQNGIWVAEQAIKTLSNPDSSNFAQALMLRALIHISQDLHSPLHICDDRKERPPEHGQCYKAFAIAGVKYEEEQLTNLAALWDSGLTAFPSVRSYHPGAEKMIAEYSRQLLLDVPRHTLSNLKDSHPANWARESLHIQRTLVLDQIRPGEPPSKDYLLRGQQVSKERIVTSGYRLAEILNQAFSP
ncbi:S1/P1 nuclease [Endozoicomonas sp. 4G]|uniref:S1/P1 nuclease n=1 Tax=Endozoicomonas sp. 4G TaxID=2872754 RepID=UPI0020789F70|nr:S1/P1 nuclease [Endozoicomonas sp. 4G]